MIRTTRIESRTFDAGENVLPQSGRVRDKVEDTPRGGVCGLPKKAHRRLGGIVNGSHLNEGAAVNGRDACAAHAADEHRLEVEDVRGSESNCEHDSRKM